MLTNASILDEYAGVKVSQDSASYRYEVFKVCFRRTWRGYWECKNFEETSYKLD